MLNFTSYKGRTLKDKELVKVYFNLHNKKWSAVAVNGVEKGLVLGHFDRVRLFDVRFVVSEAGRQRVIREGRKNVHAYAVGRFQQGEQGETLALHRHSKRKLRYNPYKLTQFHAGEVPVTSAPVVELGSRGGSVWLPRAEGA